MTSTTRTGKSFKDKVLDPLAVLMGHNETNDDNVTSPTPSTSHPPVLNPSPTTSLPINPVSASSDLTSPVAPPTSSNLHPSSHANISMAHYNPHQTFNKQAASLIC